MLKRTENQIGCPSTGWKSTIGCPLAGCETMFLKSKSSAIHVTNQAQAQDNRGHISLLVNAAATRVTAAAVRLTTSRLAWSLLLHCTQSAMPWLIKQTVGLDMFASLTTI